MSRVLCMAGIIYLRKEHLAAYPPGKRGKGDCSGASQIGCWGTLSRTSNYFLQIAVA